MSDATPAGGTPGRSDQTDPAFSAGSPAGEKPAALRVCPTCGREYEGDTRFCPRDGSVLQPKARSGDLVGEIIAERYHVLKKLGTGGMGEVYLAEHVKMGRRCALKVMHPALRQDPEAISRFGREAANASRINHPHVADVYDFGETGEGLIYLAMEYVEGEPLSALFDLGSPFPVARAVELGLQITEALDAAHGIGVVHRDLKPDNIIVARTREGRDFAKVVDFGIAKAAQSSTQNLTRTGFVVGTLHYMSPEQLMGDPVDGRSDLYSLGCILYEMLVGERPFDGPSGEVVITRRLTEPPPRPRSRNPEVPETLDEVVARLLARSSADRFENAGELRDALIALLPTPLAYRPVLTPPQPMATIERPVPAPVPTPAAPRPRQEMEAQREVPPEAAAIAAAEAVRASEVEGVSPAAAPAASGSRGGRRRAPLLAAAVIGTVLIGGGVIYALAGLQRPAPSLAVVETPQEPLPSAEGPPPVDVPEAVDASLPPEQPASPESSPAPEPTLPPPSAAPEPVRQAELRIAGNLPPGARILVNHRAIQGRTVSLPPGRHSIQVTASGFTPVDSVFTLQAGEQRSWSPQLRRSETAATPAAPTAPALAGTPVEPRPAAPERVATPEAETPRYPPPPPPSPAMDREAAAAEIRSVLDRYAKALESRDINQVRALYPSISRNEQHAWEQLFREREVRDFRVQLTGAQTPRLDGNTAEIGFGLLLSYTAGGGSQRVSQRYRATLQHEAGSWRLASIRPE